MPIKFNPLYTLTPKVVEALLRIEVSKERVLNLPLTPHVLKSLRETAKLYTTHYSTMIEGNRLDTNQIETVLKHEGHFPGRERDEGEVKGYYAALTKLEQWVGRGEPLTEHKIQTLHALVMNDGKTNPRPTPYRDGQNVIRDGKSGGIVYMPPEAKDVASLMKAMVDWVDESKHLPCPVVAGIIHYQFATIHPYYDGNGRTARLLTTFVLQAGGYDLKGLYSLEEYYARNLGAYYEAISIGNSHNYYMGRSESDITPFVEYFIEGCAQSFEKVLNQMMSPENEATPDQSAQLRKLDPKQRKALELFQDFDVVTSAQIGELFGFKPRTASALCASWVEAGFLDVVDLSKKGRKYRLKDVFLR